MSITSQWQGRGTGGVKAGACYGGTDACTDGVNRDVIQWAPWYRWFFFICITGLDRKFYPVTTSLALGLKLGLGIVLVGEDQAGLRLEWQN